MNYNHLHYFNVIAREGSLARASKVLGVSQPTLSEQLKQLESFLGERLFDRSSGALKLNTHGQRALRFTEPMFELGERLRESFSGAAPSPKVRVEIGLVASAACAMSMEQLLALFAAGDTVVRVREGDNAFLLHELISSGLDILITDGLPAQATKKGLEHRCVVSPDLAVIGAEVPDDGVGALHGGRLIHYTSFSAYRWEIDQFFREHGVEPDIVAEIDDPHVIREAVRRGVGFGIVPKSMLSEADLRSDLRIVHEIERSFEIYALYSKHDPTEETMAALKILCGA